MNDEAKSFSQSEITARLVAEAEAKINRDMAEFVRIALEYRIDANAFMSLIGTAVIQSNKPVPAYETAAPVAETVSVPVYDGTFRDLIAHYQTHANSPIHHLKFSVRQNYERSLKRLSKEIGADPIISWNAQKVQSFFDLSADEGKVSTAHEKIGKIRLLCSFGATELNDEACVRLSTIIGMKRFQPPGGSGLPRLTRDQARAIRITAREQYGWDSIALAAALLFECPKLKQMDVIGEWVPMSDAAKSDITRGTEKWIRGLRWSDLDDDFTLHRTITGRRDQKKQIRYVLKRLQMTMEEINRVPAEKRKGPMILCEFSGLPWIGTEFRRKWKIVAEKANVSLHSMDDEMDTELEAETAS